MVGILPDSRRRDLPRCPSHGEADDRKARSGCQRDRVGHLAARRRLGRRQRRRGQRGARDRLRTRRDVLRYRRRLRRRPQRAFLRRAARASPRRVRGHQDGPARRAADRELHARELPDLERPLAREPRRGAAGSGPAPLPARRRVRVRRGVRLARPDGRRRADRCLRRVGRDRGPGAVGDRSARAWPASRSSSTAFGSSRSSRSSRRRSQAGVGIIARVPLASGLLSGRYDENTAFAADDHRNFNRRGEAFDVGETFAGVPYRGRARGRPPARRTGRRGLDAGAVRAAVGDRPARRQHRDPGCA